MTSIVNVPVLPKYHRNKSINLYTYIGPKYPLMCNFLEILTNKLDWLCCPRKLSDILVDTWDLGKDVLLQPGIPGGDMPWGDGHLLGTKSSNVLLWKFWSWVSYASSNVLQKKMHNCNKQSYSRLPRGCMTPFCATSREPRLSCLRLTLRWLTLACTRLVGTASYVPGCKNCIICTRLFGAAYYICTRWAQFFAGN